MRKILFTLLTFVALSANAQRMVMNDETTDVSFVTKFLAGRLEGKFKGVNGSAELDPAHLNTSYLKMVFAVATVTTSDNTFGPNLIQPECFYPARYPFIELFSTSISKGMGENNYTFHGQLKVKGQSKTIEIPFRAVPAVGGYDITFGFAFLRKAFNLDCKGVGKEFKINVRAFAKKA